MRLTESLTGKASARAGRVPPSNEQAEKLKFMMQQAFGALGRRTKFDLVLRKCKRRRGFVYCFVKSCEITCVELPPLMVTVMRFSPN